MQYLDAISDLHSALSHCENEVFSDKGIVIAFFPQIWGSTALGFGGIGGAAVCTAYTIVLQKNNERKYAVYFRGRFAYSVSDPPNKFYDDVNNRSMLSTREAAGFGGYINKDKALAGKKR